MTEHYLAWLDIETTGLNASSDKILEITVRLTDPTGQPITHAAHHVVGVGSTELEAIKKSCSTIVLDMHEKNGLWDEVARSPLTIEQVDDHLSSWLESFGDRPIYVAGRSVGFDRGFIEAQLPRTHAAFHYRTIDLRSIIEFMTSLGFDNPEINDNHRSTGDVDGDITLFAFYRDQINNLLGAQEGN